MHPRTDITGWLQLAGQGDRSSLDQVFAALYPELRRIASGKIDCGERTLTPTLLVHEVYLRLLGNTGLVANDRKHFLAIASKAMRAFVIDHVRAATAQKRGSGAALTLSLSHQTAGLENAEMQLDWLQLDSALRALSEMNVELADLVELNFFGGVSLQEIAHMRGVDERTVRRHWQRARAFLSTRLDAPSA